MTIEKMVAACNRFGNERAVIAMKFPRAAIVRCKSGALANDLDI